MPCDKQLCSYVKGTCDVFVSFGWAYMHAKSFQSCPTLCNPMNYSSPGSSVHGILQVRVLEWVACPPPGDLPNPGIKPESPMSSALAVGFFTTSATWDTPWVGTWL